MGTRNIDFGPLQEVPSDTMNKFQETIFHSRASGAANTIAAGLDAASTSHYSRKIVASLAQPATGAFVNLDTPAGFDWRDRQIRVVLWFDPVRDIRPGEAFDKAFAMFRYEEVFYSSSGAFTKALPAVIDLQVTALGVLTINKPAGYLHLLVEGTVQIKERS